MSESEETTYQNYWSSVDTIVECIEREYEEYNNSIHDLIHSYVDGSNWIIYTHKAHDVIRYSDSEPRELWKTADTWSKAVSTAAYECMESDVMNSLRRSEEVEV